MLLEAIPEGSGGKGSALQGSVLGPGDRGQEVGISRLETVGGEMAAKVSEIGRCKVI